MISPGQTGMRHVLRLQKLVELLFGEPALFDDEVVDAAARLQRLFGDDGGPLVAEYGIERRDQANRVLDVFAAAFAVRLDTGDAPRRENDGRVAQQGETEEQVESDDGLGHV